jgi:hypothetical protein
MGAPPTPQHFLPFRRRDVVEMCVGDSRLDEADAGSFRDVCRILGAVLHFEFHERLEALKDAYAPFDPDADTRQIRELPESERADCQRRLLVELRSLLDAANFEEVTERDLERAFESESLLKVRLHVEFDDFEDVAFFRRGETVRTATVRRLWGLWKREIRFHNYDRVVVYVRFRSAEHFAERRREELSFEPGSTILKLFQNVPRPDLEMLFPNSEVRMRRVDKAMIGVPAVVSGVAVVVTKLVASLGLLILLVGAWLGVSDRDVELDQNELIALGVGIGSAGGYLVRQVSKFKNRKIRFMKTLADNLYFKNLDNDAGVFHNLLDSAEEEEHKEAVLAYWFLLTEGPASPSELDRAIEKWFAERWACEIDFEVDDALGKLHRLGLADTEGDRWRAVELEEARRHLDEVWDGYFTWNRSG